MNAESITTLPQEIRRPIQIRWKSRNSVGVARKKPFTSKQRNKSKAQALFFIKSVIIMNIAKLHFNPPETCNTYVIGDKGDPCIVIDPGSNEKDCLDNYIKKNHSKVEAILITHGHYDHIRGLKTLKSKAPVYISLLDSAFLTDPSLNLSEYLDNEFTIDDVAPSLVKDDDVLDIMNLKIKVIETPFHTAGSLCFYIESLNALFSGDTLFHLGIGRYDLPTGSSKTIYQSLKKLSKLPKQTKVYTGHGENTVLENEFLYNEYLQGFFK